MSVRMVARCLAFCVVVTGLAACASSAAPAGGPDPRFQPAARADALVQTGWELVRWTQPGGRVRSLPKPGARSRPITLIFTHELGQPRLAGFSGCNRYAGQYTMANGLLIVTSPPVSTYMACPDAALMRLEHDFLDALTRITATELRGQGAAAQLILALDSGDILEFDRRADPVTGAAAGPTKLVYVDAQRVPCSAGADRALCYRVRDGRR